MFDNHIKSAVVLHIDNCIFYVVLFISPSPKFHCPLRIVNIYSVNT